MNLLLYIFIVLISVSILFLLMYLHYFKKLKQIKSKNVEHFEIVAKIPEICEDDIKKVFYLEDGIEIMACFNNIDSETDTITRTCNLPNDCR